MPGRLSSARIVRATRIDFHRTKYGPEILVDVAWVREMPTFLHEEPHWLAFYDIMVVTRGSGTFWLDGHRHRVHRGQVLFTTPGQVRWWDVRGLDGLCLFFPAVFLEEFFSDRDFLHRLPYFHIPAADASFSVGPAGATRLTRALSRMRDELRRWRADSAHILRARLYESLVALARDFAAARGAMPMRAPHPVMLEYRRLVATRALSEDGHSVARYAVDLAMSTSQLNRLSRRHLGASAKEVIQERLEIEARRLLLLTGRSAAQISRDLGVTDPSYFTRFFRRRTGQSPAHFRASERRRGAE
jgi:AraC-like DNA-binding protein